MVTLSSIRISAIAIESSCGNVPVAASARAMIPTDSIASDGVPPAFTSASTRGPSPSRASPKITRGVTKMLPLSDARTTSRASTMITRSPCGPKIFAATSPATRTEPAI